MNNVGKSLQIHYIPLNKHTADISVKHQIFQMRTHPKNVKLM